MGSARVLFAVVLILLVPAAFTQPVRADPAATTVEALSAGSVYIENQTVTTFPYDRPRGALGTGSVQFSGTGDCSPIPQAPPEVCAFDFATLQGSGELSISWESVGTAYSLVLSLRVAPTPNPIGMPSAALPQGNLFAIFDLEYDAVLMSGSSTSTLSFRAALWALLPGLGETRILSRYTALVLGDPLSDPSDPTTWHTLFFIVWVSEPQAIDDLTGTIFNIPAADLIIHRVTQAQLAHIGIDIKPDSFPNSIYPASKGTIPVAILSTPTFDAPGQVDQSSLTFGRTGSEQSLAFCRGPEDVNNDGLSDLVCHFSTQSSGFRPGDSEGILRGRTLQGSTFEGADSVRIIV